MKAVTYSQVLGRLGFRQLSLLSALDEHRKLQRAADATHMTQPSATRTLRDIELLFGFYLFDRLPRGMQPTPRGEKVLVFARRMLAEMRRLSKELEVDLSSSAGELNIGTAAGGSPNCMLRAVITLKERHPLLSIKVHEAQEESLIRSVRSGEVDIAIGRFRIKDYRKDLRLEFIGPEPVCVAARKSHPASTGRHEVRALLVHPWVLPPISSPIRQLIEDGFGAEGLTLPPNYVECESIHDAIKIIRSSDSLAMLPQAEIAESVNRGMLAKVTVSFGRSLPQLGLLTATASLGEAAGEFVHVMRNSFSGTCINTE